MAENKSSPVMNLADVTYKDWGDGGKFEAKLGGLGQVLGAQKLGYSVTRLAPGKAAFPYHLHHANEEMFMVLEGTGTLRFADEEYPLRKGDVICCPPGPGTARQIRNTSNSELVYLAVSTRESPEVAEYPDSDKYAVMCGTMPKPEFRILGMKNAGVDYFEGESD